MPEERERPRPHGDPLAREIHDRPDESRAQRQRDAASDAIPQDDPHDFRDVADRAKGRGSTASGIPEFNEDAGEDAGNHTTTAPKP